MWCGEAEGGEGKETVCVNAGKMAKERGAEAPDML